MFYKKYLILSGSWLAEISLCSIKLTVGGILGNMDARRAGDFVSVGATDIHANTFFPSPPDSPPTRPRLTDSRFSPTREGVLELTDPRIIIKKIFRNKKYINFGKSNLL